MLQNKSKCFQYAVTVALNNSEIGKHSERVIKIESFLSIYKWK